MENIVYILITLVAGFFGLKFFKSNNDSEKEVEFKVKDAKLKENQKDKKKDILALQKKLEDARKKGEELSEEDIEDFWNND